MHGRKLVKRLFWQVIQSGKDYQAQQIHYVPNGIGIFLSSIYIFNDRERKIIMSIIRALFVTVTFILFISGVILSATAQTLKPPEAVHPVYNELKNLHISTKLVSSGRAGVAIIIPESGLYSALAKRVQGSVKEQTGVTIPILTDVFPQSGLPLNGSLVVFGNRSTNRMIEELYNRYFTLLDLKYPGPGGYVVRTLHNPFGNGYNVVFVGASDNEGMKLATDALIGIIERTASSGNSLSIDRLMEIKLGRGTEVPNDIRKFEIWEASDGYGSIGYFGWTSLSKRMAMYYMTGDEFHAREFIRLAFPNDQALKEISEIDGERVENKNEPLSGFYHYNAHIAILFWDMIEESSVFTDEERLRVTNAFSKQFEHRKDEGIYELTGPPQGVGTRHGQWAAISLYCLARYFQKDYPGPVWEHSMKASKWHFNSLNRYAWVAGENDNLFWYDTSIAPIFAYLLLTGERVPVKNGVLLELAEGLDILLSGKNGDPHLRHSSIGFLNKAAYLLNEGRYIQYRDRCSLDTSLFRLGQSFWPDKSLPAAPPNEFVGKWSIFGFSEPKWKDRKNGFKLEESFAFGSYRSSSDASGDFILIDGFNGESRNPYHTFDILRLRIDGLTLLDGYRNQVLTTSDGLVEPHIAKNAALRYRNVIGETVIAVAEVPDASYCNWQRSLVHSVGQHSIIVDDITFHENSDNMEVQFLWEVSREVSLSVVGEGSLNLAPNENARQGADSNTYSICLSDPAETTLRGRIASFQRFDTVRKDQRKTFVTVLAKSGTDKNSFSCVRVAENAAAFSLPEPGLVVSGKYAGFEGDLVIMTNNHLFGRNVRKAGFGMDIISFSRPVALDWNFQTGHLEIVSENSCTVSFGDIVFDEDIDYGTLLPQGRTTLESVKPGSKALHDISVNLERLLDEGRKLRASEKIRGTEKSYPELTTLFSLDVDEEINDILTVTDGDSNYIFTAAGTFLYIHDSQGKIIRRLTTDGEIRIMHWWDEHKLLIAGCVDERVLAYDIKGEKKWSFTSVMDPAVFRAAKTYWFKSAPGHEGIHGLHTGVFLEGESQLFVGSACTLEILDEYGALIKRMPQFWGPPSTFAIIDKPDGSLDLLAARIINGTHNVAIINNKTLDPTPRGFSSVPDGYTYVGGWMSLNRNHLFYEDLDGDGEKEVLSEINGTWNRVTVWNTAGDALFDVSIGPGNRIPNITVSGMDVADLDGDGAKEILVSTNKQLVIALDNQCRKLWSRRLSSPVRVLKCIKPSKGVLPLIIAGCEDGSVYIIDQHGKIVKKGNIAGVPVDIDSCKIAPSQNAVVLGTSDGSITLFTLTD